MAVSPKVKEIQGYLEKEKVHYETLEHPLAYTASEIAGSRHVPGKQMVKSVIVKADDRFIMCVLPAIHMIDFEKLAITTGATDIQLANEQEIAGLFPNYEIGAEPPFGHLFELNVFADNILEEDKEIVFNAGTHTEVIRISWRDYVKLVKPKLADIGTHI